VERADTGAHQPHTFFPTTNTMTIIGMKKLTQQPTHLYEY
jgi:hypothetical protein